MHRFSPTLQFNLAFPTWTISKYHSSTLRTPTLSWTCQLWVWSPNDTPDTAGRWYSSTIPDTSGVAEGVWCLTKPAMFLYFLSHQSFAELVHNAKNLEPQTHWEFLSCQVRPSKHPNTATLLRKAHCTLVAAWPCKPFVTCVQVKFKCKIHQIDILEGPLPFSIIYYASIYRSWPHLLSFLDTMSRV